MAKYELGAIYKINGRNGELYYVRLLTNECYGVFSSLEGELNEETFAQTHYRLYFSCNSFPIKRGIWGKVVSSPDSTDIARWQRPQYLANFANFNMKLFLDQCRVFHEDGNLYQCESKEEFIRLVKSGKILFCFNTYKIIPDFLMRYYKDFPNSYIVNKDFIHSGTLEYQKEQTNVLKELGFDIAYQQPNHFFKASIPDKRLEEACQSAATLNMGMELEFDERALFDAKDSFYNRLVAYIDHFERQQAFRTSAMAYYSGNHAVLDMYKSTNPKDHEVMDRLANLIVSRRGKQKKESHQTKVIAHRGFWNTPGSAQNSLAALVKADSIGCYGSEFDVWLTADDELMLNHDGWHDGYSLEKTSSDVLRTLKLAMGRICQL